ncbi:CPBP family intramembrane glutamic endopeptidase [Taibaiella koreensis]|uniref:CPBP family intramembrane glutamic endopeptidase n=1 Tax=Taibaiella koreensis TaxID=1268548 RepID=UPI000E59AC29|nr:CPBP family intramembrane glutamic endopeptidase [Taibaiella koreensis]
MKPKINFPAVIIFYAIAITFRYLTTRTDLLNGIDNGLIKTALDGIGPAIGAIVVFKLFNIKPWLSFKGNFRNIIIPLAVFAVVPVVFISTVAYITKGTIPFGAVLTVLLYGLLEELGWRGFLQNELKSLPKIVNIITVAALWFIWHLNFELTTANVMFFVILIAGTWGIGKVADKTHSLLAVSAFHSLNNFFFDFDTTKLFILLTLVIIWVGTVMIMNFRGKRFTLQ